MQVAAKMSVTIPADHRSQLDLVARADGAQLDAAAQTAVGQDSRFRVEGEMLVFTADRAPGLEEDLDHRRDRGPC